MRVIWARVLLITSCILVLIQGSPQLLYANRKDIRLVDAGRPESNSSVLASGLDDAAAVDFLYSEQKIFWTDITLTVIRQGWVNDPKRNVDVISSGLESPDGLAVDWLGRKLYWTDSETNLIEVSNLDGSYRKVLCWEHIDQPRAIALHPQIGYLWWTDWGESPKIERAGMDGNPETRSTIINENIYWPNGLTIDYEESRLYWADAKLAFIHSCNFDGTDRQTVVDGALPHPFALTLYEDSLYWTDWQTKAIHTCDKLTGKNCSIVFKHSSTNSPMDIHIYSAKRQPSDGANPCGDNNGGCSHLCLMAPSAPFYSCACPTGVKLQGNNKTCAKGAKEILLLARRSDVRRISLDTPDYTDVVLQLEDVRHAIAIDYDPVEDYVYWTDDEERTIQRAYINGTGQEVIVGAEVEHPDGVAVDWVARNLYWTDTGTDRIEVARLNGSSRRVLISENLDEPRAIVLDPVRGYMYWTDWGEVPMIERANLDGSDRIALVNTSIGWPNGLALDFSQRKLYWGDAQTDKIEVINMDGSGRKVLVNENLPHIFGFSLLGEYLYWTDWQSRSIHRVNKRTGQGKESIIEQLPDLMGLKAVDVTRIEGTNGCAHQNGGCSHLCLNRPQPKGLICACPMGFELMINGKVCIVPEAFLLFSHRTDIRRISLETGHNNMVLPLAGVKEATCLDFDINDNRIYWTDTSLRSISRAFMNGSALEHIIEHGLAYPEGMAVDWVAHNLYWADPGSHSLNGDLQVGDGRIEMSRMDGSARKVLMWKDVEPRAIALDPPKGYMYWSDWRNGGQIERGALDGTLRTPLVSGIGRVMGLTIDFSERKLYWTNVDSKDIECANLDGTNRQAILHGLPYPFGLTQYEDYLYWTDWETKSIEKANKTTGLNRTRIKDSLEYIMDISVFHASRQSGENTCGGVENGGCSHLCVAHSIDSSSMFTHHCACPTHYTLDRDNLTCIAPDTFLMYSQKTTISRILTGSNDDPDIVLPISGLKNIKSLGYDPMENNIYWLDGKSKTIKYAKDNGTNVKIVLPRHPQDLFQPYDFAIDPYARQIYWTDQKTNVINVTGLDGKPVGIVMGKPNQRPRDIVLAPEHGLMFWVNLIVPPQIERAAMDGTEDVTLFSSGFGVPGSLTLAIDVRSRKIFWADTILRRIESANFDGGNRRVLADRQIVRPVGLAVLGQVLYWVDKDRNLLEGMNKMNGSGRASHISRIELLSDIHAVQGISSEALRAHPCGVNNGDCTHLCLATKTGKRCSCPVGLSLAADMRVCTEPPTCATDEFTCTGGKNPCVPAMWRCDGVPECDDGSDEKGCSACSEQHFHCGDGQCVTKKLRCDSKADCGDGSDEEWCAPCETGFFECSEDHVCISEARMCDGKKDCAKGEDELDCDYSQTMEHSRSDSTTQYTIIVVVGLLVTMTILVVLVFACRKKNQHQLLEHQCHGTGDVNVVFTKLLNNGTATVTLKESSPPHTVARVSGGSKTSGSGLQYDRDHVTGASSSSSEVTQYPQETLNPPPSPVTDRSQCATGELYSNTSMASPSTVRSYRPPPSRHKHRAPHTSPCSTDVCEDSEPYTPLRGSSQRNKKQYYCDRYYHNPPPTPARSNYFSDEASFPPSPSTERSFFNPYNPPPSPADTSDC